MSSLRFINFELGEHKFSSFQYTHLLCGRTVPQPLRQIFSLIRSHNCELLVEEVLSFDKSNTPKETNVLNEVHKTKNIFIQHRVRNNSLEATVYRLSFFVGRSDLEGQPQFATYWKDRQKRGVEAQKQFANWYDKFLGYVYLVVFSFDGTIYHSYIYEAVIEPPVTNPERYYVHSKASFSETVAGQQVTVDGAYFAQQNQANSCCAHAAVMVARQNTLTAINGRNYSPLSDYESMNTDLGIDHDWRKAPNGLEVEEMLRLLETHVSSLHHDIYFTNRISPKAIIEFTYHAVEAGLTPVLCFEGYDGGHTMAVVGHTFEASVWTALAEHTYFEGPRVERGYKPSHTWVDGLIVQDDNFGPYTMLPTRYLLNALTQAIIPKFKWSKQPTPAVIEICAERGLRAACWPKNYKNDHANPGAKYDYLFKVIRKKCPQPRSNFWFYQLEDNVRRGSFVLRTIPITLKEYLDSLLSDKILHKEHNYDIFQCIESAIRTTNGKDTMLWLVEISIPELFQHNNRKLGEVIIQERDKEPWCNVVRLPGLFVFRNDSDRCTCYGVSDPRAQYHCGLFRHFGNSRIRKYVISNELDSDLNTEVKQ